MALHHGYCVLLCFLVNSSLIDAFNKIEDVGKSTTLQSFFNNIFHGGFTHTFQSAEAKTYFARFTGQVPSPIFPTI